MADSFQRSSVMSTRRATAAAMIQVRPAAQSSRKAQRTPMPGARPLRGPREIGHRQRRAENQSDRQLSVVAQDRHAGQRHRQDHQRHAGVLEIGREAAADGELKGPRHQHTHDRTRDDAAGDAGLARALPFDGRRRARHQIGRRRRQRLGFIQQRDQANPFREGGSARSAIAHVRFSFDTLGIVFRERRQKASPIGNMKVHGTPPRRDDEETPFGPLILSNVIKLSPFHQKIRSNYRQCYR